jgi:hypothetical protein
MAWWGTRPNRCREPRRDDGVLPGAYKSPPQAGEAQGSTAPSRAPA